MSNPDLPPETVDCIVDFLHDNPKTLRNYCLVAKSWVPRTRRHPSAIFSQKHRIVEEDVPGSSPLPRISHPHLFVKCPQAVTAEDAEEGGWIRAVSRVVRLDVVHYTPNISLQSTGSHPFSTPPLPPPPRRFRPTS